MIHLPPVGQLMHHHIILDLLGAEHQLPVVIQIPLCAAASPPGLLPPNGDPAVSHTHQLCKIGCLFRQNPPGLLPVSVLFLRGRKRQCTFVLFLLRKLPLQPVLMLPYKCLNPARRIPKRRPHHYPSFSGHLQCQGPAPAANYLIRNHML
ncbi:hypothetical protein IMSAG025_01947 [Muribaculaceae bacterium]|nr:hypothetical protein IMSAG025_01947 [Muribaculaceae bacterium]